MKECVSGDGQQNPSRESKVFHVALFSEARQGLGFGSPLISHMLTEPHLVLPRAGIKERPDPL